MKIVIEGNIGGGKSTVLNLISQRTRLPIFLEPVDTEWKDGLSLFYSDNSRWGFAFNLKVLMTYHQWRNNNFKAVYERCPLSSKCVFSQLQYENKLMTKFENDLYQQYYDTLAWESDVVIYIRTPPEVCYERMNSRARECESNVPLSYLQQVHQKYEELYDNIVHNKKQKLYIVDGIQSSEQVYEQVMNIINTL
jgi:deoxyadenosine/deoxycytidine kinase